MDILEKITEECKKNPEICMGCKLHNEYGCMVENVPAAWKVEEIRKRLSDGYKEEGA